MMQINFIYRMISLIFNYNQFRSRLIYSNKSLLSRMQRISLSALALLLFLNIHGQDNKGRENNVYSINHKVEIPVTLGLFAVNYYGFGVLKRKPVLDSTEVISLNKNDVWAFDRVALNQSHEQRFDAQNMSDISMNVSLMLPALLLIDREIRSDWFDIIVLYLETQAINSNLYTWTGPMIFNRSRPLVYYHELPMEERTASGTRNSFFSGHTSWTAGASFFTAKVYSDYHPELGGKKWLLFAAALIPPTIVGYYRIRALKHFPTDVIAGGAIGAAMGVLIPHLHKANRKNKNLSLLPFAGEYTGLTASLKF